MIAFIFALNFVISWFNAWACGTTWDSTKIKGGAAHFMNWMGAIMSASGFTWCYLVIIGLLGSITPAAWVMSPEEGEVITGMLLDPASLQAFYQLGYLIIIFPILGSGLAITVQTWRHMARRRAAGTAGAGDYAITGWNTFAQVHNMYSAVRNVPSAFEGVGSFFGGSDSKDGKGTIVIVLVILAVLGGILTTFSIIQARRRAVILEDYSRTLMDDTVAA